VQKKNDLARGTRKYRGQGIARSDVGDAHRQVAVVSDIPPLALRRPGGVAGSSTALNGSTINSHICVKACCTRVRKIAVHQADADRAGSTRAWLRWIAPQTISAYGARNRPERPRAHRNPEHDAVLVGALADTDAGSCKMRIGLHQMPVEEFGDEQIDERSRRAGYGVQPAVSALPPNVPKRRVRKSSSARVHWNIPPIPAHDEALIIRQAPGEILGEFAFGDIVDSRTDFAHFGEGRRQIEPLGASRVIASNRDSVLISLSMASATPDTGSSPPVRDRRAGAPHDAPAQRSCRQRLLVDLQLGQTCAPELLLQHRAPPPAS